MSDGALPAAHRLEVVVRCQTCEKLVEADAILVGCRSRDGRLLEAVWLDCPGCGNPLLSGVLSPLKEEAAHREATKPQIGGEQAITL